MFSPTKLQDFVNSVENRHEVQFNRLIEKLDRIINLLNKEYQYMATMQNVTDAIAAESTVDDSIITLLTESSNSSKMPRQLELLQPSTQWLLVSKLIRLRSLPR